MKQYANEANIMACDSGKNLAQRVLNCFNTNTKYSQTSRARMVDTEEVWFANQEVKTVIHESIRQKSVYIVQQLQDPLSNRSSNDNFIALLTAIDAARHADANEINVIIPQFPYGRQERRKGREGITAKLAARFLEEAGVDRVFSFDLHAEAVVGFFDDARLDNLRASEVIIPSVDHVFKNQEFVIVSPDAGGAERGNFYAKHFGYDLAIMYKTRNYSKANTIDNMKLIGDVKGKNIVIVDDMIDSGSTILKAASILKDEGAEDVLLAATFAFFSGDAVGKFDQSYKDGIIKKVISTDAVFWGEEFIAQHEWYTEVSLANKIADVIYHILKKESINQTTIS